MEVQAMASIPKILERVFETLCNMLGLVVDVAKWYLRKVIQGGILSVLLIITGFALRALGGWMHSNSLFVLGVAMAISAPILMMVLTLPTRAILAKLADLSPKVRVELEGIESGVFGMVVILSAFTMEGAVNYPKVATFITIMFMANTGTKLMVTHHSGYLKWARIGTRIATTAGLLWLAILAGLPKSVSAKVTSGHTVERMFANPERITYYLNDRDEVVRVTGAKENVQHAFSDLDGTPQLRCVSYKNEYPHCWENHTDQEFTDPDTGNLVPPITKDSWPAFKGEMKTIRDRERAHKASVEARTKATAAQEQRRLAAEVRQKEKVQVAPPVAVPAPVPVPAIKKMNLETVVTGQWQDAQTKEVYIVAQVQQATDIPGLDLRAGHNSIRYQVVGIKDAGSPDSYVIQLVPAMYVVGNTANALPRNLLWPQAELTVAKGSGKKGFWSKLKKPLLTTGGAIAGAVVGDKIGGEKGAVIGAAVGAISTNLIVTKYQGKEFNVPSGTKIPILVTASR